MSSLRVRVSRAALVGWAAGSAAPVLHGGQCELVQLPSYGFAGTNYSVRAVCPWDPDGEGPTPENLVAIGSFDRAGFAICESIALFDGSSWRSLGTDFDNSGIAELSAVTSFGGELIVGGTFETIGATAARGIARWNGVTWLPMGTELLSVSSLTHRNGQLFAVGSLAGAEVTTTVARWDGSRWSAISTPIDTTGIVAVDDVGNLLVAGPLSIDGSPRQSRVARWDGATWAILGGVFDMNIRCVLARGDDIFVGGYCTEPVAPPVSYLRRWDGANWNNVVAPIDGIVSALHMRGDDLLIGGSFQDIGGVPANRIARWDGGIFRPLGDGLEFGTLKYCCTMTDFRGDLVAGGSFGQAGDQAVANVARWDGTRWSKIGGEIGLAGTQTYTAETFIIAVGEYQGDVVIGGEVQFVAGSRNIARRTAAGWVGMGSGVSFEVFALAETSRGLLAGGHSTLSVPGPPAHPVALWNGDTWEPIGPGALPSSATVWAVAEFQGEFIIAGDLYVGNDVGEGNVRRWTGTQWLAVGPPTVVYVRDMIVHQGELIVAGLFVGRDGEYIYGIAKWNGSHWSPVGNSNDISIDVTCLTIHNGELHAGGTFGFGEGMTRHVARFDGERWQPIPDPFGVRFGSIASFGGSLFVGGWEGLVPGELTRGIGRWNADRGEWSILPISPNDGERIALRQLHATADELFVIGDVSGPSLESFGPIVARWTCEPPRPCPGDLDGNSDVNVADLAVMLSHFGEQHTGGNQVADIDGDDAVTLADLALLLRDFGAACE